MDDLDFLLEELTKATSQGAVEEKNGNNNCVAVRGKEENSDHGQVAPVYTTETTNRATPVSDSSSTHRQLRQPIESTPRSPQSATQQLDSIMKKLLGLDIEQEVGHQPKVVMPCARSPSSIASRSPCSTEIVQKRILLSTDSTSTSAIQSSDHKKKEEIIEKEEVKENEDVKSNSKANVTPDVTPKQNKAQTSIDDLLGGLSSDMEKMGVQTSAKGHCASCGKVIVGKMVAALGETWHPEHFVCGVCGIELNTTGFFEREGKPYCEKDYQQHFAPRCSYCKGPILQNILTAMDCTWHPEHFFCFECGGMFGPEGFMEREGKPYCHKDFYNLFAPKCSGCGKPVQERYLSAANGMWHPECFVCADCMQPFSDGCFMELEGRPYCAFHFHSRQGTLCGGCGAPISGRCIAAMERKFHPEHFVCAFCLRQLSQAVFKEEGGKPYCSTCHNKLFL